MGIYLYNKDEIKKIREACAITANILDVIAGFLVEGITTYDIDQEARKLVKQYGVKPAFLGYGGFPASICTSVNEVVVHGIPSKQQKLNSGDIVGIDFGVCVDGYYGDSARTFMIGDVSDQAKELCRVTRESLYIGIQNAVAGNRISDISHSVQAHVEKFGFSPVHDFVGHGLGKSLHEEPPVPNYGEPGKGPRIKDGMVFAIEPMINAGTFKVKVLNDGWTVVTLDSSLSAHFEHTIAIVDGRAEILTKGEDFS